MIGRGSFGMVVEAKPNTNSEESYAFKAVKITVDKKDYTPLI